MSIMQFYLYNNNNELFLQKENNDKIDNIKINEPVSDKKPTIEMHGLDWNKLVTLIPDVEELLIYFLDETKEYDVHPLRNLKNMRSLIISGDCPGRPSNEPKLKNIQSLSSLNLKWLTIYRKELDPSNPVYKWPKSKSYKIRKPEFAHIKSIQKTDNIINYQLENIYPAQNDNSCNNIILQSINDVSYQIIYYQGKKDTDSSSLLVNQITQEEFIKLIYGKNIIPTPKTTEELYTRKLYTCD